MAGNYLRQRHAADIFQAGLRAANPGVALRKFCQLNGEMLKVVDKIYDLSRFDKIFVLGAGKAGASMAKALEEILGDRISTGIIMVKYDHLEKLSKINQQRKQDIIELFKTSKALVQEDHSAICEKQVEEMTTKEEDFKRADGVKDYEELSESYDDLKED